MLMPFTRRWVVLSAPCVIMALGCDDSPTVYRFLQLGVIEAMVTTTGAEPDADGYRLIMDGARELHISTNGSLTIRDLEARAYMLRLEDVASNCQVAGTNPRSVIVRGARISPALFTVTCIQYTGSIHVTTMTTGVDLDPDGYAVVIDQDEHYPSDGEPIARDGALTITRVPGGEHTVSLEDVARNCVVSGDNPRPASVSPGAETRVGFVIQCEREGALRVIARTTGPDADADGYSAAIETARFDTTAALLANDAVTIGVPAGGFAVTLSGLSVNCEPAGTTSRAGNVASADTVEITFDVTCATAAQLAMVDERDGNAEIYVIKLNGADATRLTTSPGSDEDPAWSPDGTRLAFRSDREGNGEIYVMNADGSSLVRLTNNGVDDADPAWSPDGTRIAFTSQRDGNANIYVMDANGTGVTRLTDHDGSDSEPAWSPNGQRIAFMSYRDGGHDIYVMNADGSGLAAVTSSSEDDRSPAWSPDGAKIAFSRGCDYYCEYDLFVMNADGSGVTRIPIASCDEYDAAWSPDGTRIAFTSRQSYYGPSCLTSVMVVRSDGTDVTLVANGSASSPAWRP